MPESRAVSVAAYLDEKFDYEPVILSVETSGGNEDPTVPTSNKGSGGCDAGLGLAGLLAIIPALTRKKK